MLSETSKSIDEIDALRKENDLISDKKDMYLANIGEANKLNEYKELIDTYVKENESDKKDLSELKEKYEKSILEFDNDAKAKANEEKERLTKEEASYKTKIEEKKNIYEKLAIQISNQEEMLKEKQEINKKLKTMGLQEIN